MTDDTAQILRAIAALADRLGSVENGLGSVEKRLGSLETRAERTDTRLGTLADDVSALRDIMDKQPDFRLIGHQMQVMIERMASLEDKNIRAIAALHDVARESVTPGEVEALHAAMKEMQDRTFRQDARLRLVEEELHLTH